MRIPFLSRLLDYQRERRHERQLREAVATEVYEANERRKQKRETGITNPYVGASRSDTRSPYYDPTLDPLSPLSPLSPFSPIHNHPDYNDRLQEARQQAPEQDRGYDWNNAERATPHHHDSGIGSVSSHSYHDSGSSSSSSSSYDSGSSSSSDSGSSGGSSD